MSSKSDPLAASQNAGFARLRAWLKHDAAKPEGITENEAIELVRRYYEEEGLNVPDFLSVDRAVRWRLDGGRDVAIFRVSEGGRNPESIDVRRSDGKLYAEPPPLSSLRPRFPALGPSWLPPHPVDVANGGDWMYFDALESRQRRIDRKTAALAKRG